jgi:membrane protein implicated in regulation of membrane protease activity
MGSAPRSWSLSTIALVLGAILTASGLFLLGLYLAGVVDVVIDQPADRSWLFWGLGVAFIGVTLLVGGVALIVVWWRTRSDREPD